MGNGQTALKRLRDKDYVGETACSKWKAEGVFLGKVDLSDEVMVGTLKGIETTRSFRRMLAKQQWNPETLRMFVGVPWNPHGIITDSLGGIRKRYITRLAQTHV